MRYHALTLFVVVLGIVDLAPADMPGRGPRYPRPSVKFETGPTKVDRTAGLTIVRVKGPSRLLIPRRMVQSDNIETQRRFGSSPSGSDVRSVVAGLLMSGAFISFILFKRRSRAVVVSMVIGAVGVGYFAVLSDSVNADVALPGFFNKPVKPKERPAQIFKGADLKPQKAKVLGNQVSIELTNGYSVMLMLGDDYQPAERVIKRSELSPDPRRVPSIKPVSPTTSPRKPAPKDARPSLDDFSVSSDLTSGLGTARRSHTIGFTRLTECYRKCTIRPSKIHSTSERPSSSFVRGKE
jgi:hypothetical protein